MSKLNLCLFPLLFTSLALHAVITRIDKMQSPNEDIPQKYILYSITRDFSKHNDAAQFNILKKVLLNRDSCSDKEMHVMVEKPCSVDFFQYRPKITFDLDEALEKCQRTTVENIEIRSVANAAQFLMEKNGNLYDVESEMESITADHRCKVGAIKCLDLMQEYHQYEQQLKTWAKTLSKFKRSVIDPHINQLDGEWTNFINVLPAFSVPADQPLLSFLQQISYSSPGTRKVLSNTISKIFNLLFKLWILNRIDVSSKPEIMLIAGSDHIETVREILLALNNRLIITYGNSSGPEVLPAKYLDINEPSKASCSCVIF